MKRNFILKEHILTISMLLGAALSIICGSFTVFAEKCETLPENLFRLHILANSDSDGDQALKYALRDHLLDYADEMFSGCSTAEEAKTAAKDRLGEIASLSSEFVKSQGYDYPVTVSVEKVYFTTRKYGDLTVPAGEYDALRIVIGEGEGKNWWCVMFPPLCLGAVRDYVWENREIMLCRSGINSRMNGKLPVPASKRIEESSDYEARFWIYEKITEMTK